MLSPSAGSSALRGIALFIGASLSFACMDTLAKYLARDGVPVLQITWARYFFSIFCLALLIPRLRDGRRVWSQRPGLQLGRSALLLAVTLMFFTVFSMLPLVEAVSIGFTTPLMVTALAGLWLHEKVDAARWAAVFAGFLGVLVVIRPLDDVVADWPSLLMLLTAFLNALYHLSTRAIAGIDPPETTILYTNVVGAVVLSVAVPFIWVSVTGIVWVEFAALGFFAFMGHYLLIWAYSSAPASTLAPYTYMIVIWVGFLGYGVFGDLPDRWTVIGSLIVIAAGLYVFRRETQLRRAARAAPQSGAEIDGAG